MAGTGQVIGYDMAGLSALVKARGGNDEIILDLLHEAEKELVSSFNERPA